MVLEVMDIQDHGAMLIQKILCSLKRWFIVLDWAFVVELSTMISMMNQAQVGDERKTSRVFFKISTS